MECFAVYRPRIGGGVLTEALEKLDFDPFLMIEAPLKPFELGAAANFSKNFPWESCEQLSGRKSA